MNTTLLENKGSRRSRVANNAVLLGALVVSCVAVVLLSSALSARFDLTAQHINSLSPESRKVVDALFGEGGADEVVATVYVSEQLPETIQEGPGLAVDLRNVDQKLLDKLEEYRAESGGRLRIVVERVSDENVDAIIDNNDLTPLVSEEASAKVKDGKLSIKRHVLGVTLTAGKVQEVFPKATQPGLFEYELTRRLTRIHDRIKNDSQIARFREAADQLSKAVEECNKEMTRFEKPEGEEEGQEFGIQGLLSPIANAQDEMVALGKSLDDVRAKCQPVMDLLTEYTNSMGGQNNRFNAFLRGNATDGQVDGVAAYIAVANAIQTLVTDPKANPQQYSEFKEQLKAVKERVAELKKDLDSSAGERRIGVICGHGEFCPFAAETFPLDPKMAQLMGGQNQVQQVFMNVGLQIQEIVNRFQQSGGMLLGREGNFALEQVDPANPIPDHYSALVLLGPKKPFSEKERYEIDQYLMRGGTILVFADNFNVHLQGFSQSELAKAGPQAIQLFQLMGQGASIVGKYNAVARYESTVNDLLEPYGIKVNADLVLDEKSNSQIVTFDTARMTDGRQVSGMAPLPYPLLPVATDFDRSNVAVSGLHKLTMPYASSISTEEKPGQSITVTPLVRSSQDSVAFANPDLGTGATIESGGDSDGDSASETAQPAPSAGLKVLPPELKEQLASMTPNGPHDLAILAEGSFVSAFKDKPAPLAQESNDQAGKAPPSQRLESGSGRILVVGSTLGLPSVSMESFFDGVTMATLQQGEVHTLVGRFANFVTGLRQLSKVYPETFPALFNFLDWAAQHTALAQIRAKSITFRPLDPMEDSAQTAVELSAIGAVPLLFLAFGWLYWALRKRLRRKTAARMVTITAAQK